MVKVLQLTKLFTLLMTYNSLSVKTDSLDIFGESQAWSDKRFIAVDDRVRGGSSQSYLKSLPNNTAQFYGILDTKTLGGAGFASQTYSISSAPLDLSQYHGLELSYVGYDTSNYTLTLSDQISRPRHDSPKKSGVTYEVDFKAQSDSNVKRKFFKFDNFVPMYRGRPTKDGEFILNLSKVTRITFMVRSFFDQQSGPFNINLVSLKAIPSPTFIQQSSNL